MAIRSIFDLCVLCALTICAVSNCIAWKQNADTYSPERTEVVGWSATDNKVLPWTHVNDRATFLVVSAPLENDERTHQDPWCGTSCILSMYLLAYLTWPFLDHWPTAWLLFPITTWQVFYNNNYSKCFMCVKFEKGALLLAILKNCEMAAKSSMDGTSCVIIKSCKFLHPCM